MADKELKTTVTAFIFHDNKLLLIHHKRKDQWFHVGGHAEKNETPDEALEREIKEEVNLDVKFLEEFKHYGAAKDFFKELNDFKELPCPFYIHARNYGDHRKMSFDFICVAEDIKGLKIQKKELVNYKWFTKEELKEFELFKPVKILALKAFDVYEEWLSER